MNLSIRNAQSEGVSVLFLTGEVDVYTAPKLRENLYPLLEETGQQVLLDLKDVNYMDSTGLGIIIGALKLAKSTSSQLTFQNVNERIRRLLDITGLAEIVEIKNEEAGKTS
ncbi:STAS domain-containing protein [Caldalkalibacillus salinus]|uniref:STAS domain-containing protein n=1 Tax=Caldalkalibacillus salinus TaxID=2803787 RepID=UPI00192100D0|nr:STAS domain-containing protein [Caldalkalibacillus salinus]